MRYIKLLFHFIALVLYIAIGFPFTILKGITFFLSELFCEWEMKFYVDSLHKPYYIVIICQVPIYIFFILSFIFHIIYYVTNGTLFYHHRAFDKIFKVLG